MIVSYIIAAPIWKTSYRVVMDASGQPFFQGWAIVDNVSEEDWLNIQLSLVSGSPISFIEPLQQPLYRYRPVVPIPSDLQLNPQTYEPSDGTGEGRGGNMGGVTTSYIDGADAPKDRKQTSNSSGFINGQRAARKTVPQQQIQNLPLNNRNTDNLALLAPGTVAGEFGATTTSVSNALISGKSGVESEANGAEVGDLFEYRIERPVTVRRDRSALIPILQTKLEGERVSVYNEATRRDRPLSGMFLKNTSPLTLEDGPVTVLDGDAYAGEALLQRFKPGEKRFVTYALDLGTLVTARAKASREPVFLLKAINGVFQMYYYQTEQKLYKVTNQTDRPRVVYLEHPIRNDWNLTGDTPKPLDKSARFYRFRVELAARESKEIPVSERRELIDSYALSSLTLQQIELFYRSRYIDDPVRIALEKVTSLKDQIARIDAQIQTLEKEREGIAKDQARLRENIEAFNKTAEARTLIARYVAKANDQETRLEATNTETRKLNDERTRLQLQLEEAIRSFTLERKP